MTLSITAAVYPGASPQVRLVAASTAGAPSPVPNNTRITVARNHSDGSSHAVLTEVAPRLAGGAWVWLDVHCPFNQAVTYTITANGYTATSGVVWLVSNRTWLVHPTLAALSVMVEMVVELSDRSTGSRSVKFTPIGGPAVYITDGTRDGVTGSMTIFSTNTKPLQELFASDSVILINTPGSSGWDIDWMWVQPGTISYGNPMRGVRHVERLVTVPFEESADPVVGIEPVWTDDTSYAYWSSQGVNADGLTTKYADDNAFITDTRL